MHVDASPACYSRRTFLHWLLLDTGILGGHVLPELSLLPLDLLQNGPSSANDCHVVLLQRMCQLANVWINPFPGTFIIAYIPAHLIAILADARKHG